VSVAETDQDESSLTAIIDYLSRAGVTAKANIVSPSSGGVVKA
jgi:hypothetical protein